LNTKVRILIAGLLAFFAGPATGAERCPAASMASLKAELAGKGERELIFFATWCSECASHIKKPHGSETILVSTFDEKGRAEAVLKRLGIETPCFTDDGIAQSLGVREVPAQRRVRF